MVTVVSLGNYRNVSFLFQPLDFSGSNDIHLFPGARAPYSIYLPVQAQVLTGEALLETTVPRHLDNP